MKAKTLGLVLSTSLLLTACGGGSDGKKNNSSSSSSSSLPASSLASSNLSTSASSSSVAVSLYSLGGNVTGLAGTLKLQAGDQSLTLNNSGEFTFPNELAAGTQVSLVLSETPFRQTCTLNSAAQITLNTDISNIDISCVALGALTGTINNYHTGTPISNAQITVTAVDEDGATLMTATTQTNEAGAYTVEGLGISNRFVLNAWSAGYSTRSEVFSNSAEQPNVTRSALVLLANQTETFSASSAASLTVDGNVLVELPANAFVTANGSVATGTITPSLTVIDPSGDASVMPGNYEVRNPDTGAISLIESFGAIDASFRDAQGNLLQLADNTSATISIPLANGANSAPTTIPLFYFDETTGYWVQEGEATLTQANGQYFYRGTVTHFTTWNADRIYETVNVTGCIRDADNNPLANARIVASGRSYIGQSTAYSDAEGTFVIPVRMDSSLLLTSISGSQSDTIVIDDSGNTNSNIDTCLQLAESSATITLTWGENPRDLDSHFYIPDPELNIEHELYFGNETKEVNGVVFDLDVDDISSFGPEVVTVPDFPHAGTYRYLVHLYSGSGTITDSPARVELNLRGNVHVFSPGEATGDHTDSYWHVFNIVVDDAGAARVVTVQTFTDSEDSTETTLQMARNMKTGRTIKDQKPVEKERKYYAE
ncbi:carboxypeptidase regulatory-like domain-containing protein [Cellvibrio sp. NN19]|uniref:carboxypeptidase regulatory-like domain-containing protein n=1 Tax=Cellvibrio chitinivorans TaxID=3102792 RepID=UPI002B405C7A|nr:carboxypeptidase regulatory-like domain-containing protein [Cellvibrio sp. NN19]